MLESKEQQLSMTCSYSGYCIRHAIRTDLTWFIQTWSNYDVMWSNVNNVQTSIRSGFTTIHNSIYCKENSYDLQGSHHLLSVLITSLIPPMISTDHITESPMISTDHFTESPIISTDHTIVIIMMNQYLITNSGTLYRNQ